MPLPFPTTKMQWIAVGSAVAALVAFLYFFTGTFRGHAVEVTVKNGSPKPVFVYIDNTGRHGDNTSTIKLQTANKLETPSGLLISAGTARSFGTAVGLFDFPTLHIVPLTEGGLADISGLNDCAFNTVSLQKLEFPSWHARVEWTGSSCEPQH